MGDRTFKITQLADDTTLFLKDLKSLQNIIKLLSQYRKISGLSLNKKKTEILQKGAPLTLNYSLYNLNWVKERIYALGTWFYKDHNESINKTSEKRRDIRSYPEHMIPSKPYMDWQDYDYKNLVSFKG